MVKFINICFLVILLAVSGCSIQSDPLKTPSQGSDNQQELDSEQLMRIEADESTTKRLSEESIKIVEDKYFSVVMYNSYPSHSYEIYNELGNIVFSALENTQPMIQYVSPRLLRIHTHHGMPADKYTFYDIDRECISIDYWNPAAVNFDKNLIAYLYRGVNGEPALIIRDIFDKTKYYKEVTLDVSSIMPDIIIKADFLSDSSLEITYYKGTDLVETTEIISL